MEWYEDIKKLTSLSGPARESFVASHLPTTAPEAVEESEEPDDVALLENDEADEIPYSASHYSFTPVLTQETPKRPEVGRFPSDILLDRGMAEAARPTTSSSDRSLGEQDRYVLISKRPNDPMDHHHSRSSSAFSYDETVCLPNPKPFSCSRILILANSIPTPR